MLYRICSPIHLSVVGDLYVGRIKNRVAMRRFSGMRYNYSLASVHQFIPPFLCHAGFCTVEHARNSVACANGVHLAPNVCETPNGIVQQRNAGYSCPAVACLVIHRFLSGATAPDFQRSQDASTLDTAPTLCQHPYPQNTRHPCWRA